MKQQNYIYQIGDYFECYDFHPCLVIDVGSDMISGISLIDGSQKLCSICNRGIRRLPINVAIKIKLNWDTHPINNKIKKRLDQQMLNDYFDFIERE